MRILFLPVMQLNRESSKSAMFILLETYSRIQSVEKTILVDYFGRPLDEKIKDLISSFDVHYAKSQGMLSIIRLFFRTRRLAKESDLIYVYGAYPPALLFSYILSFASGRPMTFRIHHDPFDKTEKNSLLSRLILRVSMLHSRAIFFSENPSVEYLVRKQARKALRFRYGINADEYHTSEKSLDSVFIGTLGERKGVKYIVPIWQEVVKSIKTATLLILGEGPERSLLESEIKSYGLEKNIEMLGFVPDKEKIEILSRAKILFFPSLLEGFGVVIAEAMASHAVPTLWDLPSFAMFSDGVVKVSYPHVDEFATIIKRLLTDQKFFGKNSDLAFRISQGLTWESAAELEELSISKIFNRT